ncbi:hypothetical protein ABZ890_21660 [Streptomyces sp. NPDC046984]|uniref:hypothetical protein n=1 Tax=Streptomyces sp. NPDC046984 TaxID=3155138 RepID=UPI0033F3BB16
MTAVHDVGATTYVFLSDQVLGNPSTVGGVRYVAKAARVASTTSTCRGRGTVAQRAPSARSSSELEGGEVPEVAVLGNALTSLFNTLQMTQNAYAVRVSMDKSIISRYLRGRRVATEDFIDRLIREVEARRGASIQPEVRRQLTQFRLDALKVTDPATYDLEALRAEMLESERRVSMLVRHQEALHDLLEKRESQIRSVQAELESVRLDATVDLVRAERAEVELRQRVQQYSTERERLGAEIARLKAELSEIVELKDGAERRCVELEAQVRTMEEELAGRLGTSGETQLPLAALKEQLSGLITAGEQREASREVTEAAWGRSIREVAELVGWLTGRGDRSRRDRLIMEVVHARDVEEVAEFGRLLLHPEAGYFPSVLLEETAAVRNPQEIIRLHAVWYDGSTPVTAKGSLLSHLLGSRRDEGEVVEVLSQLNPYDTSTVIILEGIRARLGRDGRCARIVVGLESRGCVNLAAALCGGLFRNFAQLRSLMSGMNDQQCVYFATVMLRAEPIELIVDWLLKEFGRTSDRHAHPVPLDHRVAVFAETLRRSGRFPGARAVLAPSVREPEAYGAYPLINFMRTGLT